MLRRHFLGHSVAGGLAVGGLGGLLGGCSSGPSLVPVGSKRVDPSVIDADPLALLPSGLLGFLSIDLAAVYQTPLAGDFMNIARSVVPIGAEANFVLERDTYRMVGAAYAMQGADFCAVTQGRFDVAAISRAADQRTTLAAGVPLVKSRYREYDLYTAGNLGFSLITSGTLLSGNETGMRRALDRLRTAKVESGKLTRSIPDWIVKLLDERSAPFVAAGDFGADSVLNKPKPEEGVIQPLPPSVSIATPVLESAAQNFPFLSGLRALRLLGNLQPPGLNFAGALTYENEEKALAGASSVRSLSDMAKWANLLSMFGFGASLPPAQIAIAGREVAVVQPVDTQLARTVLGMLSGYLRR